MSLQACFGMSVFYLTWFGWSGISSSVFLLSARFCYVFVTLFSWSVQLQMGCNCHLSSCGRLEAIRARPEPSLQPAAETLREGKGGNFQVVTLIRLSFGLSRLAASSHHCGPPPPFFCMRVVYISSFFFFFFVPGLWGASFFT